MSQLHDPTLIARQQHAHYVRARDNGHSQYVEVAKRCDAFYLGDQWNPNDVKKLEEEGRPAMTFNLVLSTVNTILGEQATREVEVSFKPQRDGTREGALALGKLCRAIMQVNRYSYLENFVFADGVIQDRGYFDIRLDTKHNLRGEVKITHVDPLTVVLDPEAKEYDPETWSRVTVTRWLSLDEIAHKYGRDKADKLKSLVSQGDHYSFDSVRFGTNRFGGESLPASGAWDGVTDREVKSVRVLECQHYQWTTELVLVDPMTGDVREAPQQWDEAQVEAFAGKFGLTVMKRPGRKVRWTVTADSVVLYDDWSLYRTFTIVPFFPYYRRGNPRGMVRNLLSPQEFYNKARSQELHIVNTTANSGWITEEGSLVNMTEDELTEKGAETGLHLVYARNSQPPQKIQPNHVPTGLDRISDKTGYSIREISGVNDGMAGMSSAEVSGVALDRKTARGQIQLQQPFKHLAYTRTLVGQKVLELIQDFYTEERLITVLNPDDPDNPEEQLVINEVTEAGEVINDVTGGRYDVSIGTSPTRENADETEFASMIDMRANGIAIPDDAVIRRSPLSRRDDLADQVQKLMGQAEPTEQELEMQQKLQELEIQRLEGELSKLEAQAEQMRAAAAKDLASAEKTAGGRESPEMDLERDRLEAQVRLKREELETRLRLAAFTAQTRQAESQLRTATELARTRYQGQVQLDSAHLAMNRPDKKDD